MSAQPTDGSADNVATNEACAAGHHDRTVPYRYGNWLNMASLCRLHRAPMGPTFRHEIRRGAGTRRS